MSSNKWSKVQDQKESDFYGYSKENPKFTGDILFHIGLRRIIDTCHEARFFRSVPDYYEAVFGFYAELKFWINPEVGDPIELKLKGISSDLLLLMQQGDDPIVLFQIKQQLNELFIVINQEAHKNGLILAKLENSGKSVLDGD